MMRINKTRADYLEKFETLIAEYNAGSRNIEELFEALLTLSRSLNDEQERHVREQLSEEELTVFDLLTRPAPELTTAERAEVKRVARQLFQRLRDVLVLDWRKRASSRAQVQEAIADTLDQLPDAYTQPIFQKKCAVLFEHIFETHATG
jgi:type I restriction enzyme R subunit